MKQNVDKWMVKHENFDPHIHQSFPTLGERGPIWRIFLADLMFIFLFFWEMVPEMDQEVHLQFFGIEFLTSRRIAVEMGFCVS